MPMHLRFTLAILLCILALTRVHAQPRPECCRFTIEPEKQIYTIADTVRIAIYNHCCDTVLAAIHAFAFERGDWEMIVPDVAKMWNADAWERDEWSDMNVIPPERGFEVRVSIADIIARFRGRVLFGFSASGILPHACDPAIHGIYWQSNQFFVRPTTREEDSVLDVIQARMPKQDTVFAPYDPSINAPVIPRSIFAKQPALLVLPNPFVGVPITPSIRRPYRAMLEFVWPMESTEGHLELAITRRQIWLRSYHDNPNRDELFWVADIDPIVFATLERLTRGHHREYVRYGDDNDFAYVLHCRRYIPERLPKEWREELRSRVLESARRARYLNARRLVEIFNRVLPARARIEFPARGELDALPVVRWETRMPQ